MKDIKKENMQINEVEQTENLIRKEKNKILCEKLVIFGGALALTHGVLYANTFTFNAGIIIAVSAFTALQCSQIEKDNLSDNKAFLLKIKYHNK